MKKLFWPCLVILGIALLVFLYSLQTAEEQRNGTLIKPAEASTLHAKGPAIENIDIRTGDVTWRGNVSGDCAIFSSNIYTGDGDELKLLAAFTSRKKDAKITIVSWSSSSNDIDGGRTVRIIFSSESTSLSNF